VTTTGALDVGAKAEAEAEIETEVEGKAEDDTSAVVDCDDSRKPSGTVETPE